MNMLLMLMAASLPAPQPEPREPDFGPWPLPPEPVPFPEPFDFYAPDPDEADVLASWGLRTPGSARPSAVTFTAAERIERAATKQARKAAKRPAAGAAMSDAIRLDVCGVCLAPAEDHDAMQAHYAANPEHDGEPWLSWTVRVGTQVVWERDKPHAAEGVEVVQIGEPDEDGDRWLLLRSLHPFARHVHRPSPVELARFCEAVRPLEPDPPCVSP